jgi:hypothetical protein
MVYRISTDSNNLNGGIKGAQAADQGDDSILPGLAEHKLNPAGGYHFLWK